MEIMQLLNAIELNHFGQTYEISLNWIGQIIKWLIEGIGSVGVGVIVFSLLLKLIVLPLDVYQRVVMRKQNNKMQENQAKMEKLQKQYANDKEKYNQKVMEMYKENGISMFSSCLPMILSMVVFFSAIGGFNAYSKYANIQNYNGFVQAYNQAIESYAPATKDLSEDMITYVWDEATEGESAKGLITVKQDDKAVFYTIETVENLTETYPELLTARYGITDFDMDSYDLLCAIGKKRGMVIRGGETDTERAATMLLEEFRNCKIGRISLERVEENA